MLLIQRFFYNFEELKELSNSSVSTATQYIFFQIWYNYCFCLGLTAGQKQLDTITSSDVYLFEVDVDPNQVFDLVLIQHFHEVLKETVSICRLPHGLVTTLPLP